MNDTVDEKARTLIETHISECKETRQENRAAFKELREMLEDRRKDAGAQTRRIHDRLDHFTWWLVGLLISIVAGAAALAWYFGTLLAPLVNAHP